LCCDEAAGLVVGTGDDCDDVCIDIGVMIDDDAAACDGVTARDVVAVMMMMMMMAAIVNY
jgi:hypothetical protein